MLARPRRGFAPLAKGAKTASAAGCMNPVRRLVALLLLAWIALLASAADPVTPNASPEARALLQLLYDLSGRHTLTGQHNYPAIRDRNTQFAARYTGRTPAVFSTDWGFAREGDTDSYLARPDIVQECIRQHRRGAIITICWHAVPPTAEEPITFQPVPGADPYALASVQGRLLDSQFKDLLTPGTALYDRWCRQVDAIAVHLKTLQDARVPVLWRPYHEMNGGWFWWGGRGADTAALYRQIFDRLVNHHKLNNLVWVWSVDRVTRPGMEHDKYFPGLDYLDVLGLDVYGNDFAQSYYDSLERLAQGKPLALAEVGNAPSLEILSRQPKWTLYVVWAGMTRNTSKRAYDALFADPRLLNLDDPAYATVTTAYRSACGLPSLVTPLAGFAGHWVINEDDSQFGRSGVYSAPAALDLRIEEGRLHVRRTRIVEFADDEVTEQAHALDGSATESTITGVPRVTTARAADEGDRIEMETTVTPTRGPPGATIRVRESWTLQPGGRRLVIATTTETGSGKQETRYVFDRR
jgi:mannan endo-1,4-beta-mannosidase